MKHIVDHLAARKDRVPQIDTTQLRSIAHGRLSKSPAPPHNTNALQTSLETADTFAAVEPNLQLDNEIRESLDRIALLQEPSTAAALQAPSTTTANHQDPGRTRSRNTLTIQTSPVTNVNFQDTPTVSANTHVTSMSDSSEGLLTCFYWSTGGPGGCSKGPNCAYEHRDVGNLRSFNVLRKDDATCSFWLRGSCNKPPEECKFAHRPTRYLGPMPGEALQRLDPSPPARESRQSEALQPPREGYRLGCWYHLLGKGCFKTAEQCAFRHTSVPWIASKSRCGDPIWNEKDFGLRSAYQNNQEGFPNPITQSTEVEKLINSLTVLNATQPATTPATQLAQGLDSNRLTVKTSLLWVTPSGSRSKIQVSLSGFNNKTRDQFECETRQGLTLNIDHFCTMNVGARIIRPQFKDLYVSGAVGLTSPFPEPSNELLNVLENDKLAAVSLQKMFTLVLYPSKELKWNKILGVSRSSDQTTQLLFTICAPLSITWPSPRDISEFNMYKEDDYGPINPNAISALFQGELAEKAQRYGKNILLMLHPSRLEYRGKLTAFLREQFGAKVYHSDDRKAWPAFLQQVTYGAVIVSVTKPKLSTRN